MSPDLTPWKTRLAEARDHLSWNRTGPEAYRRALDDLVTALGRAAGWAEPGRALVALGGYGRGELAPRSDVDLLFLVDRERNRADLEAVLYPLWDLGLEVGHALRTPAECRSLAHSDLSAATALMDARLLLGDGALLTRARERAGIRPGGTRTTRRWARLILEDVEHRRRRFGEISHLLEPHLKEGRGGLRDLHACRWALECVGLDPGQVLSGLPGGPAALEGARLLGRVRNALHGVAGRKTDHLTYEHHREVAERVLPGEPVEALLDRLHPASHAIAVTWDAAADTVRSRLGIRRRRTPEPAPFASAAEVVEAVTRAARSTGGLPLHLAHRLRAAPRELRQGALTLAVGRLLGERAPAAALLLSLHDHGMLGDVHARLEEAAHRVPYDARHAFTLGIHGVEALRALERLWLGAAEDEEPHLSRIAGGLPRPAVVRVAALAHDLGKLRTLAGHAPAGAGFARDLARRLGLGPGEAAEAGELVALHHALPELAFGRDLEDPATWAEARVAAGTPERLDALTVLAYADLAATRPGSPGGTWSEWTRDLLLRLHARARGSWEADPAGASLTAALRAAGAGIPGGLADQVPPREALQVPPDLLGVLMRLASRLGDGPARWEILRPAGGPVEVLGVAHSHPRLLSATTGALARLGFDIRMFQVHGWRDGTVHLWVRCKPPSPPPAPRRIAETLCDALARGAPPPPSRGLASRRLEAMPLPTRVSLRPGSPFHSVIEVRCRDRRGLLADLTRALDDLGLTVVHALVTTHGPEARDVFHVRDIFGGRIEGEDKKRAVVERLRAAAQGTAPPR